MNRIKCLFITLGSKPYQLLQSAVRIAVGEGVEDFKSFVLIFFHLCFGILQTAGIIYKLNYLCNFRRVVVMIFNQVNDPFLFRICSIGQRIYKGQGNLFFFDVDT